MANVKIFVSHRIDLDSVRVENQVYIPVRCGAAMDTSKTPEIIGDNTGENISEKREYLGEFTVQYWAWKNVQADYYGLCHYRRYLSFAEKQFDADEKSQVVEPYLSPESIHKYRLDDPEYIKSVVEKYDILVGRYADISRMYTPRGLKNNIYQHFSAYDKYLVEKEDVELVLETIERLYPELGQSAREYLNGKWFLGYNCFILKKDLFFQLCDIEVNVLKSIAQSGRVDFTLRSSLEKRTYGFFCEWICGIFIYHLEKQKCYKVKHLQLVFFEKTETPIYIEPLKNSVAVTYLTNRYFLPMTQASIQSLIQSKKKDSMYDIIVAHEDLSKEEIKMTEIYFSQFEKISVRFISFRSMVPTASNGLRWERGDNLTYEYAFLPWILKDFSRIIYLHSDVLVYKDLSNLAQMDLSGYCLAAPRDFLRICEARRERKISYLWQKKLMLDDYNNYFSTSVMVMDLETIRKQISVDVVMRYSLGSYYPRDAMNRLFNSSVRLLPAIWNVCAYSSPALVELSNFLPDTFNSELKLASKDPSVIHYPMYPKPWQNPFEKDAWRFWKMARQIPLYERLVADFCIAYSNSTPTRNSFMPAEKESIARQISNVLLPKGSVRRKIAKKILPKGTKRWELIKKIYYKLGGR